MRGGELVSVLAQHAQQRGRAQHLGDAMLGADLVEARVARRVHGALVADHGHAVGQPADHGLDRERQPAHVGRHPVDVVLLRADLPAHVGPGAEQEAGHAVHDALGPRLGPAGEDEEGRVVRLERHGRGPGGREGERVGVGDLLFLQRKLAASPVDHDRVLDRADLAARGAQGVEQRDEAAAPVGGVQHDHDLDPCGLQPGQHGVRAEPGEQDRVDGADPVARVHGGERLDRVGHVDRDHVALGHAERDERAGQPAHLPGQLGVADGADVARLALPDHGGAIGGGRVLRPAVHAVVGHVDLAAGEVGEVAQLTGPDRVRRPHPALPLRDPGPVGVRALVVLGAGRAQQLGLGGRTPLLAQRLQRSSQQLAEIVCHRHLS